MAKPTNLFRWATGAGAVAEPAEAKKTQGWLFAERPPPRAMNWLFNGAHQWFTYLNGLHNEPEFLNKQYNWTGVHVWGTSFAIAGGTFGGPGQINVNGPVEGGAIVLDHATNEFVFKNSRARAKVLPFNFQSEDTSSSNTIWTASATLGAYSLNPGKSCIYLDLSSGDMLSGFLAWVAPHAGSITMTAREEIFNALDGSVTVNTLGTVTTSGFAVQPLQLGPFNLPINNSARRYAVSLLSTEALQICSGIMVAYAAAGPKRD